MRAPPKAARRELRGGAGAEDMVGRRWCSEREEGEGTRRENDWTCTVVDLFLIRLESDSVRLRTASHAQLTDTANTTLHHTPHTSPQRNIPPF